jgi:hexulose-6-phosphate isomerase
MKKAINHWSFPEGMPLQEIFQLASDNRFAAIELVIEEKGELSLDASPDEINRCVRLAREYGIHICGITTGLFWKYSLSAPDQETRIKSKTIVRQMIEIASRLNVETVLIVPGAVDVFFDPSFIPVPYDQVYEIAQESMREVAVDAERRGVTLCLENVWNKFLLSPLEMRSFIDDIHSPNVAACFDVGNVLAFGYPEHWVPILGNRIKRVHVKDYKTSVGTSKGFCQLLAGDVHWKEVVASLRNIQYDGYLIAEIAPTYKSFPELSIHDISVAVDRILTL